MTMMACAEMKGKKEKRSHLSAYLLAVHSRRVECRHAALKAAVDKFEVHVDEVALLPLFQLR